MSLQILLVDDDPVFCTLFRRFAKRFEPTINVECSQPTHSEWIDHRLFDVVIVDENLGDNSGLEVARAFAPTPVILISASRECRQKPNWPDCIRFFLDKRYGVPLILAAALETVKDHKQAYVA